MKKAMQLCPHAILVRGSRGDYSKFSRWVTEIIAAKAPLFEKASIDEFYIDLTGMDKFFDPFKWTIDLRQEIIDAQSAQIDTVSGATYTSGGYRDSLQSALDQIGFGS